ncbi:YfcE family phosphodiesterase [candidate division NPL-UPA2 bacterium]|nr:YfcE family phosphodiesterase [candidate division NPL-UPA2 bacterium]
MRIGAVSDSHNHRDNLRLAARKLIEEEKVEIIIHLGDDYDDAQAIESPGIELLRIPGIFSSYYQDPRIPNRLVKEFSNWKLLLTHAPTAHENDLPADRNPEDIIAKEKINIVLHGHTHIPRIEEKDNVLWLNPGHLKAEDKKSYPPSYAFVELEENQLKVRIIDLIKGEEIFAKTFKKCIKL